MTPVGYALAFGPCVACRLSFAFNPASVPSVGNRPVCEGCVRVFNARRAVLRAAVRAAVARREAEAAAPHLADRFERDVLAPLLRAGELVPVEGAPARGGPRYSASEAVRALPAWRLDPILVPADAYEPTLSVTLALDE